MSQSADTTPAPGTTPAADTVSLVREVMNRIRPAVQADGGDVELVEVTAQGIVKVRLHGACVGCPSSTITLKMGIERAIRERIPQIKAVEQVL